MNGLERRQHFADPHRQRRNPPRCVHRNQRPPGRVRDGEDQPNRDDQPEKRGEGSTRVGMLPGSTPDHDGEDDYEGSGTGHGAIVVASQDQINPFVFRTAESEVRGNHG